MDVASSQLRAEEDCPYVGLCYFDEKHARFFFGRESDAELIAANVLSCGIMVLHGPSGVGKSSVLGAALPAALQQITPGALIIPYRRWDAGFYQFLLQEAQQQATRALTMSRRQPAGDDALITRPYPGIADHDQPPPVVPAPATMAPGAVSDGPQVLLHPSAAAPASLEAVAQAWDRAADTPLVFVFDQFEQYFTGQDFGRTREDEQFEVDLARIVRLRDVQCHVMLSIREDALFELNRLRARIPNILARSLKLDFLDKEAAEEAVEGPLRVWLDEHGDCAGPTRAAPDLVASLIAQVARPGDHSRVDTPYLQLALKRLWQTEKRQGSPELRLLTLDGLRGANGIAERHFQDTIKALPDDHRRLCSVIFDRMVTPSGMKIALTAHDLAQMSGEDEDEVGAVLEHLADSRSFIIHKVSPPQPGGAPLFEIFHDVLARPIRDWIASEHERLKQEKKLAEERRLAEEERRRQQQELEQQRLEAEREQQRHREEVARQQQQIARERQMKRRYFALAVFSSVVAVAALAAFGFALSSHRDAAAKQGRMLAKQAEQELKSGDGRTALLLALAALPQQAGLLTNLTAWLNWPDRDFARSVLDQALASPVGLVLPSASGRLTLATFAPDGRSVVTGSEQGIIELWPGSAVAHLLSGGEKATQPPPLVFRHADRSRIMSVDLDASGNRLVSSDGDGTVYLWDATYPRAPLKHWDASERPVVAAISPDGALVATASFGDGKPTLWHPLGGPDFPGPEPVAVSWQTAHKYGVTAIAFDASGERLVTTSFDGTAAVWRVADGKLLQAFSHGGPPLLSARFSRDGRRLATGAWDGSVRIWALSPQAAPSPCRSKRPPCHVEDWAEKVPLLTLDHPDTVAALAFDASGRQIVTASMDGAARVWDVASGTLLRRLQGPAEVAGRNISAAISPDGGTVLATFMQRSAYFWPLQAAGSLPAVPALPPRPLAIAADVGARRVAVADDTMLKVSDAATGAVLREIALDQPPLAVAMSPGGVFVAVAGGHTVGLWSIDGEPPARRALPDCGSLVLSVAYDPVGQRLVTGYQDGSVRLWRANGEPLFGTDDRGCGAPLFAPVNGRRPAKRAPVFATAFSQDGSEVLAGSFDGRLRFADATTGREQPDRTVRIGGAILGLQPASDGPYVVADILAPPEPPAATADAVARPGDSRFRISLQIVDLASGRLLLADEAGRNRYRELLQSGNSLRLIGADGSATIVTAPLDRRLRLGPLPPADAAGEVTYARQVRLAALPPALRELSEEEKEERGLTMQTTGADQPQARADGAVTAPAAMAAPAR